MKWSIVVGIILLIIGLCLVTSGTSQAQPPTAVSVSPSSQTFGTGKSFNIVVYVTPGEPIAGVQFDLSFDATLLQVNSVTEGNLLNQGGCSTFFQPGTINNAAGTITGVAGAIITPGCTIANPGTFVNINLTSRTVSGTSPINMLNVVVGDINGLAISTTLTNGSITVTAPGITVTPTPMLTPVNTPTSTTTTPTTTAMPTVTSTPTATSTPTYTPDTTTQPAPTGTHSPTKTPAPTATTPASVPTMTPMPSPTSAGQSVNTIIFQNTGGQDKMDDYGKLLSDVNFTSQDGTITARIASGTQITDPSGQPVSEITVEETTTIPPMPEGYFLIGAFDFGPDGTTFSSALQITLKYDIGQVPAGQQPVIAFYDEATGEWVFLIGDVDTVAGTFTFSIAHFSTYALMGHSATPVVHEGITLWVWIVIGIVVVLSLIVIIGLVLQRHTVTNDTSQCNNQP